MPSSSGSPRWRWPAPGSASGPPSRCNRWPLPLGTLSVNLAGSLLAGVLVAHLEGDGRTVLVTGGLGAMTTFSSFAAEVRAMGADRRWALAVGYIALTAAGAVVAARVGLGL